MQISTRQCAGEEKNSGIDLKSASSASSVLQFKARSSVLQKLLAASKDAEVLIACLFELHSVTAAPLQKVWSKLAAAIDEAQYTVQTGRQADPSMPSDRRFRQRRP